MKNVVENWGKFTNFQVSKNTWKENLWNSRYVPNCSTFQGEFFDIILVLIFFGVIYSSVYLTNLAPPRTHWHFGHNFHSCIWYFHSTDLLRTIILTGNGIKLAIFHWWYSYWDTKLNFEHDKRLTRWRHHLKIQKSHLKSMISPLLSHA